MRGFRRTWTLTLLGAGAAIAALALVERLAAACPVCDVWRGIWVSLAGLIVYGGLFALALRSGDGPLLSSGIAIVAAVHVVLLASLVSEGRFCTLCAAAGLNASVLFGLAFSSPGVRRLRLAGTFLATLAGAVALFLASAHVRHDWLLALAEAAAGEGTVNVVVFENPACPACAELREKLLPRLEAEFAGRVRVSRRGAGGMPGLRRLPTIVVAGSGVFEGLPDYGVLRRAVEKAAR